MKVKCINTTSPRVDLRPGPPTGLTVGAVYEVAEVLDEVGQYSVINDGMKMARYMQSRFQVVDDSPVKPLRDAFNTLTTPLRTRIKQLEKELPEAQSKLSQ